MLFRTILNKYFYYILLSNARIKKTFHNSKKLNNYFFSNLLNKKKLKKHQKNFVIKKMCFIFVPLLTNKNKQNEITSKKFKK